MSICCSPLYEQLYSPHCGAGSGTPQPCWGDLGASGFGPTNLAAQPVSLATLAGIVVNNAILIDAVIEEPRREGANMIEAAREVVRDRFHAIFLTSLTTVVGLGPRLLETITQAQFLRPIVARLAFSFTTATLLSLFVNPAILTHLQDFGLNFVDMKKPK